MIVRVNTKQPIVNAGNHLHGNAHTDGKCSFLLLIENPTIDISFSLNDIL